MDKEICDLKHDAIDAHFKAHDDMLDVHANKINLLESGHATFNVQLTNLCDKLEDLVSTIKWFGMAMFSLLTGFFIWYIQTL